MPNNLIPTDDEMAAMSNVSTNTYTISYEIEEDYIKMIQTPWWSLRKEIPVKAKRWVRHSHTMGKPTDLAQDVFFNMLASFAPHGVPIRYVMLEENVPTTTVYTPTSVRTTRNNL